jgi:membrane protease YdiL (CAAX protease family)
VRVLDIFLLPDRRLRPVWRALLFVPAFLVLLVVFSTVALTLAGSERAVADLEFALMVGGWASLSAAVVTTLLFMPLLDRRSYRTLGLWFYEGWGRELALGLVGGGALISLIVGVLVLLGQVEFGSFQLDAGGALSGLGWTVLLLLPAATFEELVFRGYPFQRLLESVGALGAVLLLSVLFGLVHLTNPSPTPLSTGNTALVGIFLALAYLKTRGLWLPIGLHFAWNFWLGFVLSLPVSGLEFSRRLVAADVGGSDWLSGGRYGPEGSLVTTGVILVACFWLARTRRLGISSAMAKELQ